MLPLLFSFFSFFLQPLCHPLLASAGEHGLMFAPHAQKSQLQGKDGEACQLLAVIKLKCSSILALGEAFGCDGCVSSITLPHVTGPFWKKSAVMRCL